MPGVKGKTNNPNGRKPGTPNKDTAQLRALITRFIKKNLKTIQEDYEKIPDPKDRLSFLEKLFKYSIPTLQATAITADIEKLNPEQVHELFQKLIEDAD
jgi:hypothetical protein